MSAEKKAGRGLGMLAVVLVLLVGVYGFFGWMSYQKIMDSASEIVASASELEAAAKGGDAQTFSTCARSLDGSVESLRMELGSWVWDVASLVPVYGGDVTGARTVVRTVDGLLDDVLIPASDLWVDAASIGDVLTSSTGIAALAGLLTGDVANSASLEVAGALQQGVSLPEEFVALFDTADVEFSQAKETLADLPAFRIEALNMAVEKLDRGLDSAGETLDGVRPYVDAYKSARDTVTGAVDAASRAGTEAWSSATDAAGQAGDAVGSWASGVAEGAQDLWEQGVSAVTSAVS